MANQFFTNVLNTLENLTELKIRTLVGEFEYVPGNDNKHYEIMFNKATKIEGMISKINLASGDIDTEISPKFAAEYEQLREFHLAKENQGHEIVKKNLEVIQGIAKTIIELINNRSSVKE
jgi:hypothetical protein